MFKKLLSYITDIHLESRESEYSDELHVVLSRGRHQLCTANAIYSFDDLYDNYRRAFQKLDIANRPVKDVLILGLGLGSIPFMLEKSFEVKFDLTAVELDEEVIDLAHKYVLSDLESKVETVTADAFHFMVQNKRQFDMICMDVFIDDVIPGKFQSEKFLQALKASLTEDGILLYNRLSRTREDKKDTRAFFEGNFKMVFEKGSYLDVRGNWMLTNRSFVK